MTRKNRFYFFIALAAWAVFAAGCIHGPANKRFDPLYDKFGEVAMAGARTGQATYVFDGFSVRWVKNPRRLNKLAAGMMLIDNDTQGQRVTAVGRVALQGGDGAEKDAYKYDLDYTLVRSKKIHFFHGEVMDIDIRNGVGERKIAVNLGSHGLALFPKEQIAVFLRGFYFDTDESHDSGFPVSRFSVEIRNPEADNKGNLTFTARMELKAGMRNQYVHYGEDANRVMGKLFYTVAATRSGVLTSQTLTYDMVGARARDPGDRAVAINGAPGGYPIAFVGTQRITMDWGDSAFLIRGLRFRNQNQNYDSSTGRMRFICDAGMDNTGRTRFINKGILKTAFVLFQVRDDTGRVSQGRFTGATRNVLAEHKALSFTRTFQMSLPPPAEPIPEQAADSQQITAP